MERQDPFEPHSRKTPETHQRSAKKLARIPIKVDTGHPRLQKPSWIRASLGDPERVREVRRTLREQGLHSVCEEAACPNLGECFSLGTATFMILGDLCTRRCPFCDVAHGRPTDPDPEEPLHLATTVAALGLHHVVITSVNRDDLYDGGAGHFMACIRAIRMHAPTTCIEILTPDFRGREAAALHALSLSPPDIFNHNLETVPRLYKAVRPGADYRTSLELLKKFRAQHPDTPTKSGLMIGLGEDMEEIFCVLEDLRAYDCTMLTVGQYLQPSADHLPVLRYAPPEDFEAIREHALRLGFLAVAAAPMVRSSYHADRQAHALR